MPPLSVRRLPLSPFVDTWQAMRTFCDSRNEHTADEIWLVQHPPVYTLGQAGRREHLLRDNGIALVHSDRGGQITYHGPGQLVAYTLLDLRRRQLGLRNLVRLLEQSVTGLLAEYGIEGRGDEAAPGVYVGGKKIAALGLRLRRGGTYHGLSFNVDMDLSPFADINPCGYKGLEVTQLADLTSPVRLPEVEEGLLRHLQKRLA